jgi:hypothetical protein
MPLFIVVVCLSRIAVSVFNVVVKYVVTGVVRRLNNIKTHGKSLYIDKRSCSSLFFPRSQHLDFSHYNPRMLDFRVSEPINAEQETKRMQREGIPKPPKESREYIGSFWMTDTLPLKARARLKDLLAYFSPERLEKIVVPIISMRARVSLRALDWLVINYAKKFKVTLASDGFILNVYNDYRARLRYWQRDLFDAFRRGPRIYFDFDDLTYSTTVAQLNFLYWCESTGVLNYMNAHLEEIERDMTLCITRSKKIKQSWVEQGIKRKRCELSETSPVKCQVLDMPVRLSVNDPLQLRC